MHGTQSTIDAAEAGLAPQLEDNTMKSLFEQFDC